MLAITGQTQRSFSGAPILLSNCDVFEAFRYATEDLSLKIWQEASYRSLWLNLIKRGVCKTGAGTRFVNFGIGNTEPLVNVGKWKTIALSRDRAGCQQSGDVESEDALSTNQWQEVVVGETELEYQPEYWQLKGPLVDRKQLIFSHNIDNFIADYVNKLTIRAQREWEINYAFHYMTFARQAVATEKFVNSWNLASNFTVTETSTPDNPAYNQELKFGTTVPLKEPTSLLSQQMLEYVARDQMEQGATNPDDMGFITWEDNGPVFSLYLDMDLSQNILRLNSELRQDYRYGDPQTLIARVGANRVIGNWRHWINQRSPRFSFTQTDTDSDGDAVGTYTFIEPFVDSASANAYGPPIATKGKYAAANKLWRDATIGAALVISPDVYTSEIVPAPNGAGGLTFPPQTYMGDFRWITGAYKFNESNCLDDPIEDKGRHFAELMHAPSPNPLGVFRYGWLIFYSRTALISNTCQTYNSLS